MKVRCVNNTGEYLRNFEYESLPDNKLGRFGAFKSSYYGGITPGKEYLVMGIFILKDSQAYLLDDDGMISAVPCQLFEIIDNTVSPNWKFRLVEKDEVVYPFTQAVFGYEELVTDKTTWENLVEGNPEYERIYLLRKKEAEQKQL
ncbi:hypothetical protein [Pedobacter nyackensis]|uniref:hypothetical protein n=1 Tax=Pedobacter nyackensis TaxID=475255 RepID=UPI00292E7841|nr:hypothetical protein [Pedobacter nyackensis]